MADPVRPVPPTSAAGAIRRGRMLVLRDRVEEHAPSRDEDPEAPRKSAAHHAAAPVGAQLLGERPRRGLRAGPEVLEQARSTYLQNEYSGGRDRRPRKGQLTRTDV